MSEFDEMVASSKFLDAREGINKKFSSFDFDAWFKEELFCLGSKYNAIDVCCGRGKQIKEILNVWPNINVSGLDISPDSVEYLKILSKNIIGICSSASDYFVGNEEIKESFDLITAFYGLYYIKNQEEILDNIYKSLCKNGHFIVCGPYGENNHQLYALLSDFQEIDEFVIHTSRDYMDIVVFPYLAKLGMEIKVKTKVNTISYDSPNAVVDYLINTTFFDRNNIDNIREKLNKHFSNNSVFSIDKHIKMLVCKKI